MNTDDLIERMTQGLTPVAPLPSPGKRAAAWSVGAALYIGALVLGVALINGVAGAAGAAFWWSQAAAVAAGVLAGGAAFASVVPGSTSKLRWWAIGAAVAWLAALAVFTPGSIDWTAVPAASHERWCVAFIVMGGAPLTAVLVRMLRRGAPLAPTTTAAYAALAATALANVGACLSLPHTNGAVTLVWHGGAAAVLVVLAAVSGRVMFAWRRGA